MLSEDFPSKLFSILCECDRNSLQEKVSLVYRHLKQFRRIHKTEGCKGHNGYGALAWLQIPGQVHHRSPGEGQQLVGVDEQLLAGLHRLGLHAVAELHRDVVLTDGAEDLVNLPHLGEGEVRINKQANILLKDNKFRECS